MSGVAGELIDFLIPNFDDPLQVGFLLIIAAMILYTTVSAHWSARPASWEKKWNRGTPDRDDDDLDIEHGSVTDLWHAVATSSEKLAEIMPGMLLVVGLLGTFLGLGMALNHASAILSQSNAVADSMGDLLGLLQGLGTKFKTSTWGIMGFVMLKIWSEVTRFDEKRLIWVIDKVKGELDRRARERQAAEERKQGELFKQISRASAHIVDGISAAVSQADRSQQQLLTAINETLTQGFNRVDHSLLRTHAEMETLLLSSTRTVHGTLVSIQQTQQSSSEALVSFTQGTQEIVQHMADAAGVMASGADKVSSAANGLENVVHEFGGQFRTVLDDVRRDLSNAIGTMSERSAATLKEGSEKLEGATREISKALGVLSENVEGTMKQVETSIKQALKTQTESSIEFTATAQTLQQNIAINTLHAEELGQKIKEGLESVSNAGQHMHGIGKRLEKQTPILDRIAGREESVVLPAILQEIEAIGAVHKTLAPLVQDSLLRKLQVSEGEAP